MICRKDKLKNKIKVVQEAIKDPLATQDELVKKTGLGKGTVNRNMREMDQTGLESEIIDRVLSNDKVIMDLVAGLNVREFNKIVNKEGDTSLTDLKVMSEIAEKSTKRFAILGSKEGKPTGPVIITM